MTNLNNEPTTNEFSLGELDAVAGGGVITDAMDYARAVGESVSGMGTGPTGPCPRGGLYHRG